jgi:hypothetical protein
MVLPVWLRLARLESRVSPLERLLPAGRLQRVV